MRRNKYVQAPAIYIQIVTDRYLYASKMFETDPSGRT